MSRLKTISDKLDYIAMSRLNAEQMEYLCEIDQEVNLKDLKIQRLNEENKGLNNIINELEKYINKMIKEDSKYNDVASRYGVLNCKNILDKLKELKEGK